MESIPTLYEAAQIYAFFCLVTSLSILAINARLLYLVQPFALVGNVSYLVTTLITSFIFAPVFFIILIMFGQVYKDSIINTLLQYVDDDDEEF